MNRNARLLLLLLVAGLPWLAACGGQKHARVAPPTVPAVVSAPSPTTAATVGAPEFREEYGDRLRVGANWQEGTASYYGPQEQGNQTASGERFDYHKLTAAHRTLPLGTIVRVTNLANGRAVTVTVNDRGPFWPSRVIDLSLDAAKRIGLYDHGLGKVEITIVDLPAPSIGRYTVQVGWIRDRELVARCRREMERDGPFRVIDYTSSTGTWVRYDKHAALDRTTAIRIARELRARGLPAYIVRLN